VATELQRVAFYSITSRNNYAISAAEMFGEDFSVKFATNGVFELDEAGKCFAFGRATAGVFHLMRLMEIGVRAVARCIGIPDPIRGAERSWGAILRKIKEATNERDSGRPPWVNPEDKELFAQAYAYLDAVRIAFRNTTMHVDNKYTDDEFEQIFVAVRGFMKTIAKRMDENGEPVA
jgi:hypothetical protein